MDAGVILLPRSKLELSNPLIKFPQLLQYLILSNDPGKVDSNFFCYAASVLSPQRNVLIFKQRMHKPT